MNNNVMDESSGKAFVAMLFIITNIFNNGKNIMTT